MLDKFKAFFRGGVYENTKKNFYPIGIGRRVAVAAGGDTLFATCIEILAKNIGHRYSIALTVCGSVAAVIFALLATRHIRQDYQRTQEEANAG